MSAPRVVATAPGRVNLLGDHTDYNGGLALPMAVDLETQVVFEPDSGGELAVTSSTIPGSATFDLEGRIRSPEPHPGWATLAGAVIALVRPPTGGTLSISSTLPVSAGLSSSAALCVALSLALGLEADAVAMAEQCQQAEERTGARVGLMDPLVCMAGLAGHGLLIDFSDLHWRAIALPARIEWVVIHSGVRRDLAHSPYGRRRAECERAAEILGRSLGQATESQLVAIDDPTMRARARHVVRETERARQFAGALETHDLELAGALMTESHASLATDFGSSSPAIDELVRSLEGEPGVYGARMTGGGFGGCVVALCTPGAIDLEHWPGRAWRLGPAKGARLTVT